MHFFQAFFLSTRSPIWGRSFLDSNPSDNLGKHTVQDKRLDQVIETDKGRKIKAKSLRQTYRPVKRFNIYRTLPQDFANKTRWNANQKCVQQIVIDFFRLKNK